MESAFEIIWVVVVIIFGIFKFVKRASADNSSDEETRQQDVQEREEDPAEPGAPIFAYYYTHEGRKKVDVNKSNAASGRELTEYEIYCEQNRLDELWAQELERQEAEAMDSREAVYAAAEPVETPSMEEIMSCARSGAAEHIDAEAAISGSSSDREYQLAQLDRWLEAGLIDKAEYKKRKREL